MIWTISYELYGPYNTDGQVRSGHKRPLKWMIVENWLGGRYDRMRFIKLSILIVLGESGRSFD